MRIDTVKKIYSSFLGCEKDTEIILKRLFLEGAQNSVALKKLLLIDAKDCLDNVSYDEIVKGYSIHDLSEKQYIRLQPKIYQGEHEQVKSYIVITFDHFSPNIANTNQNPKAPSRDCLIYIDVVCNLDYWDIGNYRQRPLKIMGYIDGLLDNTKLTGIGTLHFMGAGEITVDNTMAGYTLMYQATHASDDLIPKGGTL